MSATGSSVWTASTPSANIRPQTRSGWVRATASSKARPDSFARVLDILRETCGPERLILFARAVCTAEERLEIVPLAEARPEMADMRTMVIVGSSTTRLVERGPGSARPPVLYTPRWAGPWAE